MMLIRIFQQIHLECSMLEMWMSWESYTHLLVRVIWLFLQCILEAGFMLVTEIMSITTRDVCLEELLPGIVLMAAAGDVILYAEATDPTTWLSCTVALLSW